MITTSQKSKGRRQMCATLSVIAFCLLTFTLPKAAADPSASSADTEASILKEIQQLNQVPEDQVSDKADPGMSILRTIYDQDGPDFLTLRKLVGQSTVRSTLNPSVKCVLAGVVSQRWDAFTLSGNLYLAGLKSKNPDLRDKARKKLVNFIQPAHIPALIELLKVPGPNVLAYEILEEVTGKHMDPKIKTWQAWWAKHGKSVDLVGHLIADTRSKVAGTPIHSFDQERFWYLPEGVTDTQVNFTSRPEREQSRITEWNTWATTDVKRYSDDWAIVKPVLDRIIHQPDPRVNTFLESLTTDPGLGDYASVVIAWRSNTASLEAIQSASKTLPTVGRMLGRGSLGDKTALNDLLTIIDKHQMEPLSYKIMNDDTRAILTTLRTVGVISAEQAFELLSHTNFEFEAAATPKEKKKAFKKAKVWLKKNEANLTLDAHRGFYKTSSEAK
jgi:hypothetical protein